MVDTAVNLDVYRVPLEQILKNRRIFYSLLRRSDEETATWLKQVQSCIHRCEFPSIVMKFLLIDQFVCGLNPSELKIIQGASQYWTMKQLLEHISDENVEIGYIEDESMVDRNVNQYENISLDLVKCKPVCLSII